MQQVSDAYKESMKSTLREQAYIRVSFGLFNQDAQANSTVSDGDYAYFSNADNLFVNHSYEPTYATLEENFMRVDGSMRFLSANWAYDSCLVSEKLVSEAPCAVVIQMNSGVIDFKGMTVDFGDNYPVDFDVKTDSGQTLEVRGNSDSQWITDETFLGATTVTMTFTAMKNPKSRLRIYSILFGFGMKFDNTTIISANQSSYTSLISETLPQIDFSVQLENYNHAFNFDNPTSVINYLESGQPVKVEYGYKTPGANEIEWIPGGVFECAEWEANDTSATIKCQDTLRNLAGDYYKGKVPNSNWGESLYSMADEVLQFAGVDEYDIDYSLKDMRSNLPVPRVSCREALQIIANAAHSIIEYDRNGQIKIRPLSNDVIDFTMEKADMLSSPKTVKQEQIKDLYVSWFTYGYEETDSVLFTQDSIKVEKDQIETFLLDDPSYLFSVRLDGYAGKAVLKEFGPYYVTVRFLASGTYKLEISGRKYKWVENKFVKHISDKGKDIEWSNPIISNQFAAERLANWLASYYALPVEYEYDTRGNPELDTTDLIKQENEFRPGMTVIPYNQTLKYSQGFSGHIIARRRSNDVDNS